MHSSHLAHLLMAPAAKAAFSAASRSSLYPSVYMATRADGITLLSSLINFGAMVAFLVLHVSVVVHHLIRRRSGNWFAHLLMPAAGFVILAYVVVNANIAAQRLGLAWLGLGVLVLAGLYLTGRRPVLSGLAPTQAAGRDMERV